MCMLVLLASGPPAFTHCSSFPKVDKILDFRRDLVDHLSYRVVSKLDWPGWRQLYF